MIKLEITEADYESALNKNVVDVSIRHVEGHLGEVNDTALRAIVDNLPRVVASRLHRMIPDGFTLKTITFSMQLSGKVFGCGVEGHVTCALERDP